MPVYLCRPGSESKEPWRHGVQVYERPFPLPGDDVDDDEGRGGKRPPSAASAERGAEKGAGEAGGVRQIAKVAPSSYEGRLAALHDVVDEVLAESIGEGEGEERSAGEARAVVFCGDADDPLQERILEGEGWERTAGATDDADAFFDGEGRALLAIGAEAEDLAEERLKDASAASHGVRALIHYRPPSPEAYVRRLALASAIGASRVVTFLDPPSEGGEGKEEDPLLKALRESGAQVPPEAYPGGKGPGGTSDRASGTDGSEGSSGDSDANVPPPPPPLPPSSGARASRSALRALRRAASRTSSSAGSDGGRSPTPLRGGRSDRASDAPSRPGSDPAKAKSPAAAKAGPVRRVRHAEVVLADRCLVHRGRTWLRLRWPGGRGEFGGYVALGRASDDDDEGKPRSEDGPLAENAPMCYETGAAYPSTEAMRLMKSYDDGLGASTEGGGGGGVEDSAEDGEPVFCRICREGLHDVNYDLEENEEMFAASTSTSAGATAAAAEAATARTREARGSSDSSVDSSTRQVSGGAGGGGDNRDPSSSSTTASAAIPEAVAAEHVPPGLPPDPPLVLHHPTAENPLLAPCDCTGTMAFVHYLCVEQWRMRSRHPGARGGLNCETCGAPYALPPPPARHAGMDSGGGGPGMMMGPGPGGAGGAGGDDDWLDAMPPHVLAALRRPHPAWQLGAAVVRRRWLRPVVPVLASPLVALYCRARRTLKKRGVSRRRWACSLCRRRARWKCVRCLRSYYCSRQCQNVSWHIVHKHVCYKPARFWWSVAVYGIGTCLVVPGIVENFPVYDAMVTLLPVNFVSLGIAGGGAASALKRAFGIDARGRILEVVVVVATALLTSVSSGLVRAFFGDHDRCRGVLAPARRAAGPLTEEEELDGKEEAILPRLASGPFRPPLANVVLLDIPFRQVQLWYLKWDFVVSKLGVVSRRLLCSPGSQGNTDYAAIGCSPSARKIDPQFYLEGSGRCAADVRLVTGVWFAALAVLTVGALARRVRGVARRVGGGGGGGGGGGANAGGAQRGRRRPHQD